MKIYRQIIIDIETGQPVDKLGYEYDGPIAYAKGEAPLAPASPASKIVGKLKDPIIAAAKDLILNPNATGAAVDRAVQKSTQGINNAFAARGMAGSGIATRAGNEAAQDIRLADITGQRQSLVGLLGAGTGAQSFGQAAPPRGLFGLK